MLVEKIGKNAGLVWAALENGPMETKAIKKATKLKEVDLNMAYGWLAREGKIAFAEEEKSFVVSLV